MKATARRSAGAQLLPQDEEKGESRVRARWPDFPSSESDTCADVFHNFQSRHQSMCDKVTGRPLLNIQLNFPTLFQNLVPLPFSQIELKFLMRALAICTSAPVEEFRRFHVFVDIPVIAGALT